MKISFPLKYRFNLVSHPATGMLPSVWFSLVFRYGFHITLLPKIIFISVIVVFNYFLVLMERWFFSAKINKIQIVKPVFILGHPRSGTTYLHYLLSRDTNFATPTTLQTLLPATFLLSSWIFRPLFKLFMPKKRPMDDMAMGPDLPKEEEFALGNLTTASLAGAFYFPNKFNQIFEETVMFSGNSSFEVKWKLNMTSFVKKLLYKSGREQILLKSPYNTARIKSILEVFPDARFIHLHRHPAAVYKSTSKLFESILPVLTFQKPKNELIDKFIRSSYPQVYDRFFEDVKLIEKDRIYELSFEQFTADPLNELKNIYNYFGWETYAQSKSDFEQYLAENAGHRVGQYDDQQSILENLGEDWKRISARLGYS